MFHRVTRSSPPPSLSLSSLSSVGNDNGHSGSPQSGGCSSRHFSPCSQESPVPGQALCSRQTVQPLSHHLSRSCTPPISDAGVQSRKTTSTSLTPCFISLSALPPSSLPPTSSSTVPPSLPLLTHSHSPS